MSSLLQFSINKRRLMLIFGHMYGATFMHRCKQSLAETEKLVEHLERNPYYDKYSQKIRQFQKTSPEEFKTRINKSKFQKSKLVHREVSGRTFSDVMDAKENPCFEDSIYRKPKNLDAILKTHLIEDKSAIEIKQIWKEYYKHKNGISAAIPSEIYDLMYETGRKYPIFLLPLPRGQGYEFILCQVADHAAHFTPLINYQAHKENSPKCMTMVHYTEMKKKGIVLMHGEFNKDVLDAKEAQCLANQFQLYYGKDNAKRMKLLERFNYLPNEFKHMDVIAELESLSITDLI